MKIGEIEVGKEYGVLDNPRRSAWRKLPRRVKVLEIVTVPVEQWSSGTWSAERKTVQQRQVKVTFLDEQQDGSSWGDKIEKAVCGTSVVLPTKHFVAPWEKIRKDVQARVEKQQIQAKTKADIEGRLMAIVGVTDVGELESYADVTVYDNGRVWINLHVRGGEVEKLLAAAEAS